MPAPNDSRMPTRVAPGATPTGPLAPNAPPRSPAVVVPCDAPAASVIAVTPLPTTAPAKERDSAPSNCPASEGSATSNPSSISDALTPAPSAHAQASTTFAPQPAPVA